MLGIDSFYCNFARSIVLSLFYLPTPTSGAFVISGRMLSLGAIYAIYGQPEQARTRVRDEMGFE